MTTELKIGQKVTYQTKNAGKTYTEEGVIVGFTSKRVKVLTFGDTYNLKAENLTVIP